MADHLVGVLEIFTGTVTPASVTEAKYEDIVLWKRMVSPHVPFGTIGYDWNWTSRYLGCRLLEIPQNRTVVAYQLRVKGTKGGFPLGQVILSFPYPSPGDTSLDCVFVWLLAKAPTDALVKNGINGKYSVLGPLLDIAVQVSLDNGLDGRIGLHAAVSESKDESDALAARYTALGLSRRAAARGRFRPFRPNDGRLFYLTEADAAVFSAQFDSLR